MDAQGNGQGTAVAETAGVRAPLAWQVAGSGSRAFKGGLYGPPGSGKTTTASLLARYIAKRLKKTEAYMIDSEGGADYVASLFKVEGITLKVRRTREFGILVQTFEQMHDADEVILVDSVTHFSDDVIKAFLSSSHKSRLDLRDFSTIYGTWREFSEPFMSSHLNAIVCGRMGNVYTSVVNEQGRTEMIQTDSKMKASDQFGHEPDFLLEMEQVVNAAAQEQLNKATTKQERARAADALKRDSTLNIVATVRKDRTRLTMGQQFVFTPSTDDAKSGKAVEAAFKPVIDWHLKNKTQDGIVETGATRAMMTPEGNEFEWQQKKRREDFCLDEIKETFTKYFPSTSGKDKQAKIEIAEQVFGVKSWEGICQQTLETLEAAITPLEGAPSVLEQRCIEKQEAMQAAPKADKPKSEGGF